MAKYINKFDTVAQYNAEKDNLDYPSINYIVETDSLEYYTLAPTPSYETQYLTFVAMEDGTFKFSKTGLSYSLDSGNTWTTLASNTNSPTVQSGSTIMWKGNLIPSSGGIGKFSSTGEFDVEGNVMSLLYGDNFIGQTSLVGKNYAFVNLFNGCLNLVNAENFVLPATTLADGCYMGMFFGCTSLTTTPELPATILSKECYNTMFCNCTSLTTAPILSATTLQGSCYFNMFQGCTSLTTAPELLATTLVSQCYMQMFLGCSNLNYIKCIATDISASNCTRYWVNDVSSNGTFVKTAGMNDWGSGNNGIPENWTVEDAE